MAFGSLFVACLVAALVFDAQAMGMPQPGMHVNDQSTDYYHIVTTDKGDFGEIFFNWIDPESGEPSATGWKFRLQQVTELDMSYFPDMSRQVGGDDMGMGMGMNIQSRRVNVTSVDNTTAVIDWEYKMDPFTANFTWEGSMTSRPVPIDDVDTEKIWDSEGLAPRVETNVDLSIDGWKFDPMSFGCCHHVRAVFIMEPVDLELDWEWADVDCPSNGPCTVALNIPTWKYHEGEDEGPKNPLEAKDKLEEKANGGDDGADSGVGTLQVKFPGEVYLDGTKMKASDSYWEEYWEPNHHMRWIVTFPNDGTNGGDGSLAYNQYEMRDIKVTAFSGAGAICASIALMLISLVFLLM